MGAGDNISAENTGNKILRESESGRRPLTEADNSIKSVLKAYTNELGEALPYL